MNLNDLLSELEEKGLRNDAAQTAKSEKYLNITRDTGEFLRVLIRTARAARILEVGTSNGYSTIWLAASIPPGGRVTTVEHSEKRAEEARANFERAGVAERIELVCGDAGTVLRGTDETFDLIFLDADRSQYMDMLDDLLRVLVPGGLIVCDNAVSHESELSEFMAAVTSLDGWSTARVPVGKGEFLAHKPV